MTASLWATNVMNGLLRFRMLSSTVNRINQKVRHAIDQVRFSLKHVFSQVARTAAVNFKGVVVLQLMMFDF